MQQADEESKSSPVKGNSIRSTWRCHCGHKKGFHMVLQWVKMLEVVRDEARGVGQSQTKKTIRRQK